MEETEKRPVNTKLIAIIAGAVLTVAAIVVVCLLIGIFSDPTTDSDDSPKFQKKYAATDAANLRSVIAEAYINVMSDSNFVGPTGSEKKILLSLEAAAGTSEVGYYTEVECKSHPGAELVVTIDSNNNVDAYFLTDEGKMLTLNHLSDLADEGNRADEDDVGFGNTEANDKVNAGTDAANLRSVIAEAYINVMSDSNFIPPSGSSKLVLLSLEKAAKEGGTGYYSEVECYSVPSATLVVEIDSNNNVDAYFLTKSGKKLGLEHFTALAGTARD